jgi:large subunit ribosomal protein L7/L12
MTCSACGHASPAGAQRCENCGVRIAEESEAGRVSPSELVDRVQALLDAGQKIAAIKAFREATGASLVEAKAAVEALERGGPLSSELAPASSEEEVLALLKQGQKINAIKLYRQRTGAGLKEAKDAVEELARRYAIKEAGCASLLVFVFTLLACWMLAGS